MWRQFKHQCLCANTVRITGGCRLYSFGPSADLLCRATVCVNHGAYLSIFHLDRFKPLAVITVWQTK